MAGAGKPDGWAHLGKFFTKSTWPKGSFKGACIDAGLEVSVADNWGQWFARLPRPVAALWDAVRAAAGASDGKGATEWVTAAELEAHYPQAKWHWTNLREACEEAGVDISTVDEDGLWFSRIAKWML